MIDTRKDSCPRALNSRYKTDKGDGFRTSSAKTGDAIARHAAIRMVFMG